MARDSKIEWTDHTFNPWWGCTKVSEACDNCYADTWARRFGFDIWGHKNARRLLSDRYWQQPHAWNQAAEKVGNRKRVFCASMADIFEWHRNLSTWRERLWKLIDATPYLDWLLLTKRPHLIKQNSPWGGRWPTNVWLGITVESQRWANKRIPRLLENPAKVHFLSCEPLLGQIQIDTWLQDRSIHWVIAGGESGPKSRPSDPSWVYQLRDACINADIPFLFKQWGDWAPVTGNSKCPPRSVVLVGDNSVPMGRFGKKAAGREVAGMTWNQFPEVEN